MNDKSEKIIIVSTILLVFVIVISAQLYQMERTRL
jgi:hypothetical protein